MMTPTEKYLFDLHGFLIVRGVLSPEEVASANGETPEIGLSCNALRDAGKFGRRM